MDITETEKKNIKSRQKKLKKVDFKHVIKYMVYLKNIMKNNRSMMQAPQSVRLGDQEAVMGYDQVGQVSYGDFDENTVSGNMIKSIIKLNENENIFTEDEITNCIAFIKSYADFILFLEYKNPLYMSIAILCIDKKQSSPIQTLPTLQPYSSVVQDYGGEDYGDYGDYGGEDYGGGGDYGDYGGGDDYGGGGEDDWV